MPTAPMAEADALEKRQMAKASALASGVSPNSPPSPLVRRHIGIATRRSAGMPDIRSTVSGCALVLDQRTYFDRCVARFDE